MAFRPPTIQRFNTQPVATQSRSRLPRALAKGFRAGETQVSDFLVPAASPSKRELLQLHNDRAQLPGEVLGAAGMGRTTSEPGRGPRSRVPAPACPAPRSPFSRTSSLWHFLRSCSSRRYLRSSSWLLLLTSSMAWPIWWETCSAVRAPPPGRLAPCPHPALSPGHARSRVEFSR